MINTAQIIKNANKLGVAVPAFNVPYLPMIEPIVNAVIECDSFALIETSRLEWIKFGSQSLRNVYEEYTKWEKPEYVRLHLDHVPVIDEDNLIVDYMPIIKEAIELGYQSVMIDGSRLSLEENIKATKQVAELAHKAGIPCEAELGAVLGHEEGPMLPYEEVFNSRKGFTKVEEAKRFVNETGCDWLSVAVGNIHGAISMALRDHTKQKAKLDIEHVEMLSRATGIPLVLHGGSGISNEHFLQATKKGIAKVNVATDIRQPYELKMKETGDIICAQNVVYECTCNLIKNYYHVDGLRAKLTS